MKMKPLSISKQNIVTTLRSRGEFIKRTLTGNNGTKSVGVGGTPAVQYTADISGVTDGKEGTVAFWVFVPAAGYTANAYICRSTGGKIIIRFDAAERFDCIIQNSVPQIRMRMRDSAGISLDAWHHVVCSWNVSGGGTTANKLYIDGVLRTLSTDQTTDDTLDYSDGTLHVFTNTIGTENLVGRATQLYMSDRHVDLTDSTILAKFYDSGYVDYGDDGSKPDGTAPLFLYETRDAETVSDFPTNKGSGGDLTLAAGTPTLEDGPGS